MADSSYFNPETNLSYISLESDGQISPTDETLSELPHSSSAPTRPVYINMGAREATSDRTPTEPITTTTTTTANPPLLPSYADHLSASTTVPRHNSHHHRAYRLRTQNRYPYVPYFNRPSAFRRDKTPNGTEPISKKIILANHLF